MLKNTKYSGEPGAVAGALRSRHCSGARPETWPSRSHTHFPYSSRENRGDGDRDCSNCSENGFSDCDVEWLVACWLNLDTMSRKDILRDNTPRRVRCAVRCVVMARVPRAPVALQCVRNRRNCEVFKLETGCQEIPRKKPSPARCKRTHVVRDVSIFSQTSRNLTKLAAAAPGHLRTSRNGIP